MSRNIPICPNCGSSKITEKFVEAKDKLKPKEISLKEYAQKKELPSPINNIAWINSFYNTPDYIQFVCSCDECGYTVIQDLAKQEIKGVG